MTGIGKIKPDCQQYLTPPIKKKSFAREKHRKAKSIILWSACKHNPQSLEFNRIINRTSKINKNKKYPQKVK